MKKVVSIICLIILDNISIAQKEAKKIEVFNTKLKTTEIIGTTKSSTASIKYYLPEILLKNSIYHLETIGSYRQCLECTEPYALFNLIDGGDYPLLDEINMKFYDEVGIPRLKPEIRNRSDFKQFYEKWKSTSDYKERKKLFSDYDELIDIGNIIQRTRFQETPVEFTFTQEATKKLAANVRANIKSELKSKNINASAEIIDRLSIMVNSSITYKGILNTIEFNDLYMTRLKNAFHEMNASMLGKDDFSLGLIEYASPGSLKVLTSGLIVLQLKGEIDRSSITENIIKADLSAAFPELQPSELTSISLAIGVSYATKISSRFTTEINNSYILAYLTSDKLDVIELINGIHGFSLPLQ